MPETVLVTGASGFLASHCILQLLEQGHTVRGTVRSLARADEVRARITRAAGRDPGAALTFAAADLMQDAGWREAATGCAYVLHVASPFPAATPKHPDDLIIPARDGAVRVIKAAASAGVKRVVLTSSTASISEGAPEPASGVYDETSWTNPKARGVPAYPQSKVIAERAAWDAAREANIELAVINPSAILGPVLDGDLSTSIQIVQRFLSGSIPGCPRLGFAVVDVRDVADAHLRAMTTPAAAGERFIAAGGTLWMADVAAILKRRFPAYASKVKANGVPDFVVRLLALGDPTIRGQIPNLGRERSFSHAKAARILGWKPRSDEDAVVATGESLIALKLV